MAGELFRACVFPRALGTDGSGYREIPPADRDIHRANAGAGREEMSGKRPYVHLYDRRVHRRPWGVGSSKEDGEKFRICEELSVCYSGIQRGKTSCL